MAGWLDTSTRHYNVLYYLMSTVMTKQWAFPFAIIYCYSLMLTQQSLHFLSEYQDSVFQEQEVNAKSLLLMTIYNISQKANEVDFLCLFELLSISSWVLYIQHKLYAFLRVCICMWGAPWKHVKEGKMFQISKSKQVLWMD